jgi:hypothetical protein
MKNKKELILWGGVFLIFVGWLYYRDSQKGKFLLDSKYNYAVISKKYHASRLGNYIEVYHFLNDQINISENFDPESCYGDIKIGDTVLISYAVEAPKIVKIENCYWDYKKHNKLVGMKVKKLKPLEILSLVNLKK